MAPFFSYVTFILFFLSFLNVLFLHDGTDNEPEEYPDRQSKADVPMQSRSYGDAKAYTISIRSSYRNLVL